MRQARLLLASGLFCIQVASAAAQESPPPPASSNRFGPPPAALHADPFYAKYVDAGGIPVLSSDKAPTAALLRARDIVDAMLAQRPDLRAGLVTAGYRVVVMAQSEGTLDLPEQRDWKKPARDDPRLTPCERKHYAARIGALTDRQYWDGRARGMGGPITSVGAENLLGVPGSRYFGQNILIHEFSHAILIAAMTRDPALFAELGRAYADAMAAGRWKGEYAAVSVHEYWAVGTQIWFNTGELVRIGGRAILSHQDLQAYDPALYRVLGEVYGGRHHIEADAFYLSPARIPPGPPRENTAEIC